MNHLKPWREIAIPHTDVLEGSFQQSEFAADLNAVYNGMATKEYQEAQSFYQRTFITEGMRLLLTSVAIRLSGKGGDPVIQLQTSFGGGKTHTMLSVYHLATRSTNLTELPGVTEVLERAGISDVPKARVAVLDGNSLAPGQPRTHGDITVNTLWGELAWQLGKNTLFNLCAESDAAGTSPGKEVLRSILEQAAPAVILIDELVAYIRQFEPGQRLPGGTYDSNLSFLQALTEAVKLVPNAILLASLPESEVEAGSSHGLGVLKALEKTFGRVQALWKPVATEEAFEIVRRRLFQDIRNNEARDAVCDAYADLYITEGNRFPSETQESGYRTRMLKAYPIHPEVFDRLYEDWSALQGFQRTRGVLKLMALVIHRLWQDQNQDYLIMPGNFPLSDSTCRSELISHLSPGWDPVVDKDIDGPHAETIELENREPRYGSVMALRRVARTIFLGTAPDSGNLRAINKGLDSARILLGTVQVHQETALYVDAINRLIDKLHYLNSSGEKTQENTRYWFDTRANLRREMEDRKSRFDDKREVRDRIAKELKSLLNSSNLFEGIHVFAPHSDIPDDTALRLVILPPSSHFDLNDTKIAFTEVKEFVKNNGNKPRHHSNRLLFLAPDALSYSRLSDAVRTALSWESIVEDIATLRLNCDKQQEQQAKQYSQKSSAIISTIIRECFKWLLCPAQFNATDRDFVIEHYSIPHAGSSYTAAMERVCEENELIISTWAATHLCNILKQHYWKGDIRYTPIKQFWDDSTKYIYLPRLKNISILYDAIQRGSSSRDFFGLALSQENNQFQGFSYGNSLYSVDSEAILIDPSLALSIEKELLEEKRKRDEDNKVQPPRSDPIKPQPEEVSDGSETTPPPPIGKTPIQTKQYFHGSVNIPTTSFKVTLNDISDEILQHLVSNPDATIEVRLEINADFGKGADSALQRTISENARNLRFTCAEWE